MILFKLIGWTLILISIAIGGLELWDLSTTGRFSFSTWGELWYRLDPGSLNLYQAMVERYISPGLWDDYLAPLLLEDAFFVFALPGLFLAAIPGIIKLFGRVFFGRD